MHYLFKFKSTFDLCYIYTLYNIVFNYYLHIYHTILWLTTFQKFLILNPITQNYIFDFCLLFCHITFNVSFFIYLLLSS